ncbi:aldo/keto reductase [Epidermidibacterium keratini]|uniref:Aldo/keto reductase n=1 Tax=Epidermidibacterium keratini TaxID=1891644 RepID=A0A7L4YSL9_9ACTN|nr:aldo/keto reductase [Epidermidibacterium keratini]QHC02090.1 aldo/keto reductase [Epidermidibacterium keratini]
MTANVPSIELNSGTTIPQVGFGVFQVPPPETTQAVQNALDAGYRHIDTARIYDNEEAVGQAIKDSGIDRDDLFITTKLWNSDQGYDETLAAFDASMQRLGLDVLDLYLIHWPTPAQDKYVDTWRAFEKLQSDGRIKAIGVSNFQISHLKRLAEETDIVPAVNQIELHPWLAQTELRDYHSSHGIVTEAWSPLARGGDFLKNETLGEIAAKHDRTPAQVMLRWHIQLGNVVIPRTVNADRAVQNISLFDFELDADDIAAIATLDAGTRIGPDPDDFNVA